MVILFNHLPWIVYHIKITIEDEEMKSCNGIACKHMYLSKRQYRKLLLFEGK